jgi:glycosyltransferase involved in cell wall biosynthesis
MEQKEGYLPKNQRKKILLITDDIRVHSGVATVSRELVLNTVHRYNWVNIGGAINHPEAGKKLDLNQSTADMSGVPDAEVSLYPTNGYGDPNFLRIIMEIEKPDAIFLVTDPRYFVWLFQMENEIRKKTPIIYLNIWDDIPAPMYNKEFYESCDALLAISKQTLNINQMVLGSKVKNKILKYVPHGLDHNNFKPIESSTPELQQFRKQILGDLNPEFALLFNSRNIRRKQLPDAILAFKLFLDRLPKEEANKCTFILHTQPVDENGTDIPALVEYLFDDYPNAVRFTQGVFAPNQMNLLYNLVDATILLTSNEGWGLALTESLLCGKMIIANVTGGMQDQMRFEKDGNWIDFNSDFPSNHKGTIKDHGKWALPVYPSNSSIQGSVPTPYIYDDRCKPEDAADQIMALYNMSKEERTERGLAGKEWAVSEEAGFTGEIMGKRVIEAIDELFTTWQPREEFELLSDSDYEKRVLPHKLVY